MRTVRARAGVVLALVCALVVVMAGIASAHVTVHPDEAEKGGFEILSFSVPNEKPDASTVALSVQMPEDNPLPFVSVQPKPGWTVEVTKKQLDEPVKAFGEDVTEVVDTVTWTGGQINPGEFDLFLVSVGPLPKNAKQLEFKSLQTYSDGEVVRWIESTPKSGEEPEFPAPTLKLVKAEEGGGH